MKRILFIAAHRQGRSPSQRFRFEQFIPILKQNGYEVDYSYLITAKDDKAFYSKGKYFAKLRILASSVSIRLRDVKRSNKYDYIFVQREAFMLGSAYFEKQFAKTSAKLIFDFDDAIWLPDVSGGNSSLAWLKRPSKTINIIRNSDTVIAGNSYLAEFAANYNANTHIIPTTIDTDLYRPQNDKKAGSICIGWSGSFSTLKHFDLVVPALGLLKEQFRDQVTFKVISDGKYSNSSLDVIETRWSLETEIEELSEIDIGLMPLPDDQWSKGKCGFKGLLYMALGIPSIMSPVGVNSEIIEHGVNGFLAQDDNDWIKYISMLANSAELRNSIAAAGRKTVEQRYSVKSNQEKFLSIFD